MKKFICLITAILIFSMAALPVFADTGEYNDFVLYDAANNNSTVSSGAFYSNDVSPMTSFTLFVDPVTQKWSISSGSQVNIPRPNNKVVDTANFSSLAKVIVNGTTYNFVSIPQTDSYAVYNIPASPYYPTISVYIPFTTQSSSDIPTTPVLSISGSSLSWTPTGYTAKVLYSTDGSQYNVYRNQVNPVENPLTIQLDQSAYFRVQLYYTENGETRLTEVSNRVEYTYVAPDPEEPDDNKTIWDYLSDLIDGITNASRVIRDFLSEMRAFFYQLFSWLPESVMTVFWAVVIIGLVLGILIK